MLSYFISQFDWTNFARSNTKLQQIGDRLVKMIVTEYSSIGCSVFPNYGHSEGADILNINPDGKVFAVCECKNYAKITKEGKAEYVASEKFRKDIDNLNKYDCLPNIEKWYIVSYDCILTFEQKEVLKLNNIKLREIGYQV
jgi:hypothetical protein